MNMVRTNKRGLFASVLLASASWALSAPIATAQSNGAESDFNDEIIVTAQKKSQSVLDVGIAVSVLGEQEIAERRIEAATDLVAFTPNATVKENLPGLMPIITIRGVGLNDFNAANNPATGVYVDEVSLSSLALLSSDLFDLERMEVLKGPQGTLYGRNSSAGALNIISAKPKLGSQEGRISAGFGNYKSYDLEGMANLSVSENLAIRLSGKQIIQDEGFYFDETLDRDIGRRDVFMARAQALYEPSDTVDILLKVEGQRGRSELGNPEFFGAVPTATETNCPGLPSCSNFFGYTDTDGEPFQGSWSVDPSYNYEQFGTTASISADLGFGTLNAVSGYINFSREYSSDVDATNLRLVEFRNTDDVNQISQEIRFSRDTALVDWQIGAFYAEDNVDTTYSGDFRDLFNTTLFTLADQTTKSLAGFANAEWRLADDLSFVSGLRYTNEKRETVAFTQDNVSEVGGSFLTMAPLGTPAITLASVDDVIDDNSWAWKLGLNWKPADSTLVYASISQGTKSGGFFTGVATNSAQLQAYKPETLISYEAGVKGVSSELGLRYEASAFYYDYSDVQTFIRDTVGALPIQRLGNVDEAKVYGADIALSYRPKSLEGLSLNAGVGLLSTELGTFAASAGNVPAGNKLPDAPDLTLNLGTAYEFAVGNELMMKFAVDGRYQSAAFRDAINDPLLESDAYWTTNARVSIFAPDDWDFSIWGKNLGDKRYVTQGLNQLVFGNGYKVYGAPKTYGVSLTKNFN